LAYADTLVLCKINIITAWRGRGELKAGGKKITVSEKSSGSGNPPLIKGECMSRSGGKTFLLWCCLLTGATKRKLWLRRRGA